MTALGDCCRSGITDRRPSADSQLVVGAGQVLLRPWSTVLATRGQFAGNTYDRQRKGIELASQSIACPALSQLGQHVTGAARPSWDSTRSGVASLSSIIPSLVVEPFPQAATAPPRRDGGRSVGEVRGRRWTAASGRPRAVPQPSTRWPQAIVHRRVRFARVSLK
jgi:hypothetical protein